MTAPQQDGSGPTRRPLDLGRSVHDLCGQYPELLEILRSLGFADIVKPGMLQTAGRFMTLPKGARVHGIPLETLRERLENEGFEVVG